MTLTTTHRVAVDPHIRGGQALRLAVLLAAACIAPLQSVIGEDRTSNGVMPPSYTDPRSRWMPNVTHLGAAVRAADWPSLTTVELAALRQKPAGWYAHATGGGTAGHLQWGQAMPVVEYSDAGRTSPASYGDVGDTSAWTGQLLGALAHRFVVEPDAGVLPIIARVLQGYDRATTCTIHIGYVPRSWAHANESSIAWKAWRSYFTPNPP